MLDRHETNSRMESNVIDFAIATEVHYVAAESRPDDGRYVFAYTMTIANSGTRPATLTHRHWLVTNGAGDVQEVRGEGVVGKQPRIEPGESFRYTSAAVLDTPVGSMHGSYRFVDDDELTFDVAIPAFRLAMPNAVH